MTAELMVEAAAALEAGDLPLTPQQEEGVIYAEKISKEETRVDWNRPARDAHNHIRGLSPFPGAWCEMDIGGKPQRVKLLASELAQGSGKPGALLGNDLPGNELVVACGDGAVRLVRVQRAGKQTQSAEEFLRGNRIEAVA